MKKLAVVLIVMLLFTAVAVGQAADIKAGWAVDISQVSVWTQNSSGAICFYTSGRFITPIGIYDPFIVTSPLSNDTSRCATVISDRYGIGPNSSLILPIYLGDEGTSISYIKAAYGANYDSNQMTLQLWKSCSNQSDKLLYAWPGSGGNEDNIYIGDKIDGNYYFKVAINNVPEPSSILSLIFGLGGVGGMMLRRKSSGGRLY